MIGNGRDPAIGEGSSPADAKARLLFWADETDAHKAQARSSVGAIAARSTLAVLGGMAIVRLLRAPRASRGSREKSVGRRLISWAVVARV
ncbi:MAG: hypothetical protein AABZ53_14515, partial [Planctomycetota bacterium]